MEDYKAYQAIAQIKQIVHDAGLCVANEIPCGSVLKRDLNRLEELAYIVRAYYDATKDEAFAREVASVPRHVFPQIIKWKKLQSKTQASVARCHRMLYEIATHTNEPQQEPVKPDTKPMGIDEALEFCRDERRERAKVYFKKAMQKEWIKATETGLKWYKSKVELAYFCGRVFCPKNTERFPGTALDKLFGANRLQSALTQIQDAKKPQKWKPIIDSIFEDNQSTY